MNVQKRNDGVSIYCLSSGPTLPEWIGERARRNLSKRDENIRRRIELLQDFQMPSSSSRIVQSGDGRYIIAAGTYPPRIRCYDLHELTMKFERYVDSEIVDVAMLGDDYGKFALLLSDRTIAFHAPYGSHTSVRIPTFGRSMTYEPATCELLVAASGGYVYRINLQDGRFSVPWTVNPDNSSSSSNGGSTTSPTCIDVHPLHPLATAGCDDGIVRFYDSRSPDTLTPFLRLDVQSSTAGYGYYDNEDATAAAGGGFGYNGNPNEIRSVAHDPSGMYVSAGSAGGVVALYDIRSSRPLHVKEHKDGLPIHTVKFHPHSGCVLSGDPKLIKVWKYKTSSSSSAGGGGNNTLTNDFNVGNGVGNNNGESSSIGSVMVNIEATSGDSSGGGNQFAHFIVAGDSKDPRGSRSGVVLCAADQPKMESFYVPALGTAPSWCSFLENITEELEERDLQRGGPNSSSDTLVRDGKETIYENYKFVSRDDVEKLGISNLVGTPLLRGYMHGFFMDINLYNRVKAVANPFEYEEYRKKKLRERMEAKRGSRIAPRPSDKKRGGTKESAPAASVNPELAGRLHGKAGDTTKAGKVANQLLSDSRFGSLFTNPDFQIDEEDPDFKLRNPSGIAAAKRRKNNMDSDDEDESGDYGDGDEVGGDGVGSDGDNDEDSAAYKADRKEIIDDDDSYGVSDDDSMSDDSDEDGFIGGKVRGEAYESVKAMERGNKQKREIEKDKKKKKRNQGATSMYEAEELDGKSAVQLGLGNDDASKQARRRLEELNMPLSKRVAKLQQGGGSASDNHPGIQIRVEGGTKEATFIPLDVRKKMEREDAEKRRSEQARGKGKRQRRGVKELGLRKPPATYHRHQK